MGAASAVLLAGFQTRVKGPGKWDRGAGSGVEAALPFGEAGDFGGPQAVLQCQSAREPHSAHRARTPLGSAALLRAAVQHRACGLTCGALEAGAGDAYSGLS